MQAVAQSWLVLQLTDSAFRLGLISTFLFIPMLLFSIPAGAVADRLPKRRVVVTSALVQAAMGFALTALVATGAIRYWHVAAIAVVWGLVNAIDTPARQAFLVDLVGRGDVGNAIALNSAAFNGARIVGPAVAGVLIGAFGLAAAFLMNAIAGLIGALALAAVRTSGAAIPRGDASFGQHALEGLRYASGTPRVRRLLGVLFVVTITIFNFSVYIPLLTRDVLAQGPGTFGLLMAAIGIGAMTGAFALGAASRAEPPFFLLAAAAVVSCAGLCILSVVTQVWMAALVLLIVGLASIVAVAGVNTALQMMAPDALRGRVMSIYTLIFGGVFPFGAFLAGITAETWGVRTALGGAGGFGLMVLAVILVAGGRRAMAIGDPSG
jgi:predicted MFS family arabinose efflux permease